MLIFSSSLVNAAAKSAILALKDGTYLTGDDQKYLIIWDYSVPKYTLTGHSGMITNAIQLKNNDIASCGIDNRILIWDWTTKTLKYNLTGHSNEVFGLAVLRNGYLASGGKDSQIIIWKWKLNSAKWF